MIVQRFTERWRHCCIFEHFYYDLTFSSKVFYDFQTTISDFLFYKLYHNSVFTGEIYCVFSNDFVEFYIFL